jgi:hypothetical protein
VDQNTNKEEEEEDGVLHGVFREWKCSEVFRELAKILCNKIEEKKE